MNGVDGRNLLFTPGTACDIPFRGRVQYFCFLKISNIQVIRIIFVLIFFHLEHHRGSSVTLTQGLNAIVSIYFMLHRIAYNL